VTNKIQVTFWLNSICYLFHYFFYQIARKGPSWSYGSWIYNYLCNQCLLPLKLWVRIPLRRGVLNTTLCDKVCQWLAAGLWFTRVTIRPRRPLPCYLIKKIMKKITDGIQSESHLYFICHSSDNCFWLNTEQNTYNPN
jgi:hypothetical protein